MEYKTLYKEFYNNIRLIEEDVADYIDENNIDETDGQHIWFGMVVSYDHMSGHYKPNIRFMKEADKAFSKLPDYLFKGGRKK